MFSAHGIAVVIGAENHASLLGPLGSSFLSLDIWVDEEDSEEAAALLRDIRERDESGDGDDDDDDDDGDGDDDGPSGAGDDHDDRGGSLQLRIERRRRTSVVVLLGCCLTLGTAHMFTRAWMRGLALAAVEVVGFMQLWAGNAIGGVAIAAAIVTDLIGALWRVRAAPRPTLPAARVLGGWRVAGGEHRR